MTFEMIIVAGCNSKFEYAAKISPDPRFIWPLTSSRIEVENLDFIGQVLRPSLPGFTEADCVKLTIDAPDEAHAIILTSESQLRPDYIDYPPW